MKTTTRATVCSQPGCGGPVCAKGLCRRCYDRQWRAKRGQALATAEPAVAQGNMSRAAACREPGCTSQVWARGLCRRCYAAAYHQVNRERLRRAARDRNPEPAVVRPKAVSLECVSCSHWFTIPAVMVGQVVGCPRCHRLLSVVLEVTTAGCLHCGGPIPAGSDRRTAYCTTACRVAAKEARRRDRRRAS